MKRLLLIGILGTMSLWLAGCGYQNSNLVAKRERADLEATIGAPVSLHVGMWGNRTNELGLQMAFFNALSTWFQSSDLTVLTKKSGQAEYALDGEVISVNQGRTRGTVRLTVGYGLLDLRSGETVWRVPRQTFSESYFIADDAATTQGRKRRAMEKIADDLAESIYMRTLRTLRDRRPAAAAAAPASDAPAPADAPASDAAPAPADAPVIVPAPADAPAPAGTESHPSR